METPDLMGKVEARIIAPTLAELARRGAAFSGVLYAGLMVNPAGEPLVVEFNCRFGDPEAQAILPRVSWGLVESLVACAAGEAVPPIGVSPDAAVTTVLAARGYPDRVERGGAAITIPPNLPAGVLVFHAGTRRDEAGVLRTHGGRVLAVTGIGPTFDEAQAASRAAADAIDFAGKQFRRDIGWRELARAV
jgi:phosphoribosylamine--glycine ligase